MQGSAERSSLSFEQLYCVFCVIAGQSPYVGTFNSPRCYSLYDHYFWSLMSPCLLSRCFLCLRTSCLCLFIITDTTNIGWGVYPIIIIRLTTPTHHLSINKCQLLSPTKIFFNLVAPQRMFLSYTWLPTPPPLVPAFVPSTSPGYLLYTILGFSVARHTQNELPHPVSTVRRRPTIKKLCHDDCSRLPWHASYWRGLRALPGLSVILLVTTWSPPTSPKVEN